MNEVPEKIEEAIGKIVAGEGLELVHIEYRKMGRNFLLRIDIDKDGGVNIDDCSLVAQQVSTFLDVEDFVPGEYELQVSSPGLDRKFYKDSDYQKFLGRLVRVRTGVPVKGIHVIIGHLREFDGESIVVVDPKNRIEYPVSLADIKETRLEVEV